LNSRRRAIRPGSDRASAARRQRCDCRGTPWQSHVAVHVGEQVVAAGAMGTPWQSQVAVHVGVHAPLAAGATGGVIGEPWQSQVDVHVGEHVVAAGAGVTRDGVMGLP
jgi:hypothetical protein